MLKKNIGSDMRELMKSLNAKYSENLSQILFKLQLFKGVVPNVAVYAVLWALELLL